MTDAIEAWTRRTGVNPSGILFDDAKDMVVRALPIDGVQVIAWLTGGTCGGCGGGVVCSAPRCRAGPLLGTTRYKLNDD